MGASLYEPINVYKPVAANIGIVDGPFEYLTVGGAKLPLPFTTRMTVVRLSNDTTEPGLTSLIYRRSGRGSCTRCSVFLRADRSFRPFRAFS